MTEKNSVIFNDPDFEIFLDPDGDNHDYYEFEINALGTIWELWLERPYRDRGPIHRGHNLDGVKSVVAIDGTLNDPGDIDRGWGVEIAIPWEALAKFGGARSGPPRDGDRWRINFSRVHWGIDIVDGAYRKVPREVCPEANWVWTPQDAIDNTTAMTYITLGRNGAFTLPAMNFAGSPAGIDVRKVVDTGIQPIINTGIAHREAGIGQIGAGLTRAPLACFTQAVSALASAMRGSQ